MPTKRKVSRRSSNRRGQVEIKHYVPTLANTGISTSGTLLGLTPAKGTDYNQRVGNGLTLVNCKVRMMFTPSDASQSIRVLLFRASRTIASATDLFISGNWYHGINPEVNVEIYKDKMIGFPAQSTNAIGSYPTVPFEIDIPLNLPMRYDSAGNADGPQFYFLAISDSSVASHPVAFGHVDYSFIDE